MVSSATGLLAPEAHLELNDGMAYLLASNEMEDYRQTEENPNYQNHRTLCYDLYPLSYPVTSLPVESSISSSCLCAVWHRRLAINTSIAFLKIHSQL